MSSKTRIGLWWKRNSIYVLGFVIPFLILGILFRQKEVFPFGDNIYLRSDMYHQYAPFYKELYRKLIEGGSLSFSWNIGMGVNFSAIYAYYLASPVNLLLGLVPEGSILVVMDLLILGKTGLAGAACTYYLSRHFRKRNVSTVAFGLFYALSSYMAAFSWNIMWLDCMVLLPLVILGLESLVKEKKFKLYTISLALAIFSNYYIAIMICIFVVLYFCVQVIVYAKEEKNYYRDCFIRFAVCSLLAGGMAAVMILPEIYALGYTASGEFSFPETWLNYFSVMDMLRRSLISTPVAIFEAHDPNVYCSVAVFLLLPLYCMCRKVNEREKIGKMILVVILLISFNTNIPNYIWHGFHFPNSLPARESFIYIFLVVTMMYEAFLYVRCMTKKQLWGAFAGAMGIVLLIEELYQDEVTFDNIYITLIFIAFYMLVLLFKYHKIVYDKMLVYLLLVVCSAEMFINSGEEAAYKPTTYSAYLEDNAAIETMVENVEKKDKSFFRIEKLTRRTKNDAAWNDYHGVSIFSSMANAGFTEYLGKLGFEQSTNAYSYYGFTPLTSSLLSVKYVFSNEVQEDTNRYTFVEYNEEQNKYLYQVNHCLPLGFMLPENFLDEFTMEGNNPFAIQNQFAQLATGESEIFHYIPASTTNKTVTIPVEEDSHVFVYVTTYVENISYSASNSDGSFSKTDSFSGLNHRQIVDFGEMPAGTTVTVNTSDSDASSLQLYAYSFDWDAFARVYEKMEQEVLQVESYDDTNIKGAVNCAEDGLLYTSIIYDEGWTVKIDGKKAEYVAFEDALLAVPVKAGSHTIEFSYRPQGLNMGIMISVVSLLLFIGLWVFESKKKKSLSAVTVVDLQTHDADRMADEIVKDIDVIQLMGEETEDELAVQPDEKEKTDEDVKAEPGEKEKMDEDAKMEDSFDETLDEPELEQNALQSVWKSDKEAETIVEK